MSPLFNERYAPEPGFVRSDDARKRREFEEEFKRGFDPQRNRMLSPAEIERRDRTMAAANYWLDKHNQEEAREIAEKNRRLAAQKARQEAERKARDLHQRRAQWEFNEGLIDREIADLSTEEKRQLGEKLGPRITDIDAVTIGAEEIRLGRK
jgi:hypothetical protein